MLSTLARPGIKADVTWSPVDPRWYRDLDAAMPSDAGMVVLPEKALSIAVVYRAVNVIAHAVASIPLVVNRILERDAKERARDHPAYDLLHDQPAPWLTSFRWRQLMVVQAILWGKHNSEIIPGPGGIGGLVPLNPNTTRLRDQLADGRLLYTTQEAFPDGRTGPERRILSDNMLHVRGFSIDGKEGIPLTKLARNAMGLALVAERHGSMFLKHGARLQGYLSSATTMDPEVRKAREAEWNSQYSGSGASGRTPLLTGGLEYKTIGANAKDSQWVEGRTFQVEELLRFIGVPGNLVGYADKTATHASAEQFFLSFVKHTVQPWTENIAAELNLSVIVGSPEFFASFILEGLLKGDIKTRYQAYKDGILSGWMNRNEARVREDMNRGPEELDEFWQPRNIGEAGEEPEGGAMAPRDRNQAHLRAIAARSAERLVQIEIDAIQGKPGQLGAASRFADDPEGWGDYLDRFYERHAALVSEDLRVPIDVARQYCGTQRERFANLATVGASATPQSVRSLLQITPGFEDYHAAQ